MFIIKLTSKNKNYCKINFLFFIKKKKKNKNFQRESR